MTENHDTGRTSGVFVNLSTGNGFIRQLSQPFQRHPDNVFVSGELIRQFGLTQGVSVEGDFETTSQGKSLININKLGGLSPEKYKNRTLFKQLIAIDPNEKFNLGQSHLRDVRILDLVSPIGKGTRGLIVSPPKAGKTTLLEHLAQAIHAGHPEVEIMVLLIDERPEEVTHFRRSVDAQVLASSSDQSIEEHMALTEFTLSHIRTELECGQDVVLLVDSLTRMGRVFNSGQTGQNRVLSGGMGERALEIPRRFFGLARNIENGGSVTILATVLIDTGSRMDQLIFEEFKGTGNSEIVLDRLLAEQRLFPAVNISASGTRKEALLIGPEKLDGYNRMHKNLADLDSKAGLEMLLSLTKSTQNNLELLDAF